MPFAGSTVALVKGALFDALASALAGEDCKVLYSPPERPADDRAPDAPTGVDDIVFLAEATATIEPGGLGTPMPLAEDIDLEVVIQVRRPTSSGTQRLCDERATELLGLVLDVIRADRTVGVDLALSDLASLVVIPAGWTLTNGVTTNKGGNAMGHGSSFAVAVAAQAKWCQ